MSNLFSRFVQLRRFNQALRRENHALRRENNQLRRAFVEARTDELTGAYNRRWLRQYWSSLNRPGRQLAAVIQVDIDKFKSINDRYGHEVGDHAIVHVADALRRHSSHVVRTGGDEFVILVPREQEPRALAEAVLTEASRPMPVPDGDLTATISVGVCRIREADEPMDLSTLMERADAAMYAAKRQRGNQLVMA